MQDHHGGHSNLSESKSVNAIAHGMAADSRGRGIDPRQLFDQHLDTLRQSVGFAGECGTQQPISYFLADSGAANVGPRRAEADNRLKV
jgi:hypothetical protein